jgi:hypothetical protein
MATGDEKVNLELKRFLSANRLDANFLEYLRKVSRDNLKELLPNEGLFTYPVSITINGTSGTPSDFDLSVSPAGDIEGTDGLGNIIVLALADQTGIDFEHAAGETYWIGLKYIEIPTGLYINTRTGLPEYDKIEEAIGELYEPTSVTDNGTNITFNVNDIFESGVDHTGRTVRVWLKNPLTSDPAVAFEDVQVVYSATDNEITTTGLLGQTTPVSVVASDYYVAALGPTVRKSASNPFNLSGPEYIIIGSILDATATDETLQRDFSGGGGHTLQKAYDGAGAGAGKDITADNEAVRILQTNTTIAEKDILQAGLRIVKDGDTSGPSTVPYSAKDLECGLDVLMRIIAYNSGQMVRVNLQDLGGDKILGEEPVEVTAGGSTLTFTRGGNLDLQMSGRDGELQAAFDLVEIKNSSNGNDGVYVISSVASSTTLSLATLDFITAASLVAETGTGMTAKIYRTAVKVGQGGQIGLQIHGLGDWMQDGSSTHVALDLIVPANMDPTGVVISALTQPGGSYIFRVDRNGDVLSDGDITADQDITASNGDITADNGDIIATLGDITATAGKVEAGLSGGVAIEATSATGDIQAGQDVIAGRHVEADQDVVADADATFTGEFKYGATRTWYKQYNAHDFEIASPGNNWTKEPNDTLESDGSGTSVVTLPFTIPNGASFVRARVKIDENGTNPVTIKVRVKDCEFDSPSTSPSGGGVGTDLGSDASSSGADGYQVVACPTADQNELQTNQKVFYLRIAGNNSHTVIIFGVQIEYTYDKVHP